MSSLTKPILSACRKSRSITAVCSFNCFSDAGQFPSFLALWIRLGVKTMARLLVPILLCCEHDATFARNLIMNCRVVRCVMGRSRHRSRTASTWSPSSSKRWVLTKQSWRWFVNSGSGNCLKNCFTKLATSCGCTFWSSSPRSAFC